MATLTQQCPTVKRRRLSQSSAPNSVVGQPRIVPVQGFQRQQYGHQGFDFVPSQLHQQVQYFGFQNQNPNPTVGSFTSATMIRADQVYGLNQHPPPTTSLLWPYATMSSAVPDEIPVTRPVASVSHQVSLEQLSSFVMSALVQPIEQPKEEIITSVEDDEVPSEFDADWLKVRHESVIKSLYSDIPRQCQTCGRRFKTQEEHSKHMDWHVLKNREIKKMKNVKRSQHWYYTPSLWLKATDILTETHNGGPVPEFLRRDSSLEVKKDDEDFSVPADEDQKLCALCMEAFEFYYSDETEDWMYKGAVYMKNASKGSMASGKDRSKLGPIVHAKCL